MDHAKLLILLENALAIRKNAYAPYSGYLVGCAILLKDGQVISGVNVENASYPVTICAERSAMAFVVAKGFVNEVLAVAVATSGLSLASPCGMCRQFLLEFLHDDVPLIMGNDGNESKVIRVGELLPFAFRKKDLEK